MKIIGFSGVSGSGKSYRALDVAAEHNVKYIIDDGLLISRKRVVAGKSAKKEKTRLASVRCALFFDSGHAEAVKKAIKEENPEGILVLGTSHEMIEKIADKLELPKVTYFVEIEDVASSEEMEMAHDMRHNQGKHVIPVPTFEIKKDFSGYWMDALKKISRKKTDDPENERTIVRPTFSYMGEFVISPKAIENIASNEAMKVSGVVKTMSCDCKQLDGKVYVKVELAVKYGKRVDKIGKAVCESISKGIEEYTSISLTKVTTVIKDIVF